MSIPRGAVRTTTFIVVGLTVLACAFFVWLLTVAASSSMAHVTERVTKAVAEAQARNPRRPVIRGEAVPGSAWAEYEHGLALAKGVVVVRSTRVGEGVVRRNIEVSDDKIGTVASMDLVPGKARVLLKLSLALTSDPKKIQEYFNTY